jgi:perosamine synthetase
MTGKLSIVRISKIFVSALKKSFLSPYFGFIEGHQYLAKPILRDIRELVGKDNDQIVNKFENNFSSLVGDGKCIAFAAGRMGFFCLMQEIGIKQGDQVILQSSTCSVMVNAVLRIGAIPIYSDINNDTFSSSLNDIKKVLTNKTKLIVSQHSFGIPCDIEPIAYFAKKNSIFLLEDCALTVGSSINGKICGNFGNAALFSTDHTKPINTISGGLIYTNCLQLYGRLKNRQVSSDRLNSKKQKKIWHQFNLERKYCNPNKFGKLRIVQLIYSNLLGLTRDVFNSADYGSNIELRDEYPAKIPAFMALIGIQEIKKWPERQNERKKVLQFLCEEIEIIFGKILPNTYMDKSKNIIPLRLAWSCEDGTSIRKLLFSTLDVDSTWFLEPIISTNEPLINFSYSTGSCLVSEKIGPNMINIPCNISYDFAKILINNIKLIKEQKS